MTLSLEGFQSPPRTDEYLLIKLKKRDATRAGHMVSERLYIYIIHIIYINKKYNINPIGWYGLWNENCGRKSPLTYYTLYYYDKEKNVCVFYYYFFFIITHKYIYLLLQR